MLPGGREIDDGVDPLGRDAEDEDQLDVPVAVGVDEGVHAAGRGAPDPVRDAVTVRDRDRAVALQPLVVGLAHQADDRGPGTAREPDGERADPAAAPEMTKVSPCLGWTACTAPHAVAPETNRPPAASQETFAGLRVRSPASTRTSSAWEGVDAGRLHSYQDLPVPGHRHRAFHLIDPQHVDSAELVVPDCRWHDLCISLRLEPRPAAAQAGSPMSIRCRNFLPGGALPGLPPDR